MKRTCSSFHLVPSVTLNFLMPNFICFIFLFALLLWHFFGQSWASADSYFGSWQRRHRLSTGRLLSFIHFFLSWEMPPNTSQPFLPGGWGRWRVGCWREGVSKNSRGWGRRLRGWRSGQTCYVELSRVFPRHQIAQKSGFFFLFVFKFSFAPTQPWIWWMSVYACKSQVYVQTCFHCILD